MGNIRYLSKASIITPHRIIHRYRPIQDNIRHFISMQEELTLTYEHEQADYIKRNIFDIENTASNKRSTIAWNILSSR